ncbi:hypothetical protein JL100_003580 [Skermanella mucosa]|uniref:hypothetical protein n=1 Tax=Skermanella mucosa TaxID=1789672 RepID=UPI00192B1A95|nr:hypothetical protein [Skermanella mucosa]UEM21861.1 hypothetical protein JL100_003580 [Skermanella mucosa]
MTDVGSAAGGTVTARLAELADAQTDVDHYREAMREIGRILGYSFGSRADVSQESLYVAMTVEDADFLGAGFLEALAAHGAQDIGIACFWNRRDRPFNVKWLEIAPIVQEYRDPLPEHLDHLIVLKSIISGGCVVKTNLMHLLEDVDPERMHVIAPVMLEGSEERLKSEFPPETAARFEYLTLAHDTVHDPDGMVRPGIGGEVYGRLGLGSQADKNMYLPEIVRRHMESYEERHTPLRGPAI